MSSTNGIMNGGKGTKAISNFTADFIGASKIDDATIKINLEKGVYTLMEESGAIFTPLTSPAQFFNPVSGAMEIDETKKYVINGNTGEMLGDVGEGFNAMAHWDTMQAGLGELTERGNIPAKVICFNGGRRVLVTFFGGVQNIADRTHHKYFNYFNGIDGTTKSKFGGSDFCLQCKNMFSRAMKQINEFKMGAKHTVNMEAKLKLIRKELGLVEAEMNNYYVALDKFATVKTDLSVALQFTAALIPDKEKEEDERDNNGPTNRRNELFGHIIEMQKQRNTADLTIYDLFGGVTSYITTRQQKRDNVEQLSYVLEGPGATFAEKGFNWLTNYANSR
jgi:hypothetical protein